MNPGVRVDRFTIVERIGEGGMAAVYGVRHTTLGTPHALKVLTVHSESIHERLVQEGRLQARLAHPHVVAVTDVLDVDGAPGLLMEYVHGPTLDQWLHAHRPSITEALCVFRGILAGVAHAHEVGVVHRDLKPGNVMLSVGPDGTVTPKVMDFGLAKSFSTTRSTVRTRAGAVLGTPSYMPPEQIRDSSKVDRRADIYALGCLLYELVCGRRAFDGDDVVELFQRIRAGRYEPAHTIVPDLPFPVTDAIVGMLATDRTQRISDCAAVMEVLHGRSALASLTLAQKVSTPEGLPPPREFVAMGAAVLAPSSPGAEVAARMTRPPLPIAPDAGAQDTLPLTEEAPRPSPAPPSSPSIVPVVGGIVAIGVVTGTLGAVLAAVLLLVLWALL